MKRFSYDSCVDEGLLRRVPPSREKAEGSMKAARRWIDEAKRSLEGGALNSSALSSYLAMFHSARAILFSDGWREKSHYCIARYLERTYVEEGRLEKNWLDLLDHYRELRHESQYDFSFHISGREAEEMLKTAQGFTLKMGELLAAEIRG